MSYRGKRALDLVIAVPGLALTAPIQGVCALVIWASMGRPILFRQARPGLNGQPFLMYKFRTMRPPGPARILDDGARLTRLGSFMRATSLDELPTLWNVIRGDMSIVGPRPLLMSYLCRYTAAQARRHEVRPGITGLAQVRGRNAITWDQKFYYDVAYVDDHSLAADLRIISLTMRMVLQRKGISAPGAATMPEFVGGPA